MTSVIVTSSPREREHLRSMCAPTRALSRIVLSLTKPNDNIKKIIPQLYNTDRGLKLCMELYLIGWV